MARSLLEGRHTNPGAKMKLRIIVLTCALAAEACGGAETRPTQDPTSSTTTGAVTSDPTSPPSASEPFVTVTPSSTLAANTAPVPARASQSQPAATAAQPAAAGPVVVNNPGVADQTKNADNTTINDRDRRGTLTPMDQGNSSAETKITATIRKGIMGDKSLSFTAKNVKIITTGNKVTLRGPVNSDRERAAIEAFAKQTAGVSEVDNLIEVKK
jgi:hypothetical protein